MAYNRHIWTNNEAITYQKLNTIEDAVSELNSASPLSTITVHASSVSSAGSWVRYELDKTWNEIYSYILEGNNVVVLVNIPAYNILFITPVLSVDEYLPSNDPDSYNWSVKCEGNSYLESGTWTTYDGADSYPATDFYLD